MLKAVHIAHNGLCQVGQISLTKVSERKLAEAFRKGDAHILDLAVHKAVSCLVLLQVCEERKDQEPEDQKQYGQHAGQWFSFRQSTDKTVHHEIKDAHSAHDDQVDDHRPERPHFRIMNALLRQREFALKFLSEHLIPPRFHLRSSSSRPSGNQSTCVHKARLRQ